MKPDFDISDSDNDGDSSPNRKGFANQKIIELSKTHLKNENNTNVNQNGNNEKSYNLKGRIYRLENFYASPHILKPRHHFQKDYPDSEDDDVFEN